MITVEFEDKKCRAIVIIDGGGSAGGGFGLAINCRK